MMRKLYWKIFVSFWLTSSIIVISTIWATGLVTRQATIPIRERLILHNYAYAAVSTYEFGKTESLKKWRDNIANTKGLDFYLISPNKIINSPELTPTLVKKIQKQYHDGELEDGLIRNGNFYVSHEILTLQGEPYRLIFIKSSPITITTEIVVPWAVVFSEMLFAIIFCGIICYFLSRYLTMPIAKLCEASRKIACGDLDTRLPNTLLNRQDEIGELSSEFNHMAERLDQLIKVKERLLQDISHELRSPLARLQIAIAICQNKAPEAWAPDFERMINDVEHLDSLIGEILSLAKLQTPNQIINKVDTDLKPMIENIISNATFEYQDKNVQVNVEAPQTSTKIQAEWKLIYRAIDNIVRNALNYTFKDTILTIKLEPQDEAVYLEISDQGPGVPEEDLHAIFNAFYRVDGSGKTTKSGGGYGIGLAMTKKIIDLHHGTITAMNVSPTGLCFKIQLPKLCIKKH